jgi:uncharacterized membrane protein YbhN (UPF0104 family)
LKNAEKQNSTPKTKPSLVRKLFSQMGWLIFILALLAIARELQGYEWQEVLRSMNQIPLLRLLGGLIFTIFSYIAIAYYDIIAFEYINQPLSKIKIAFAGLITYSISPTVGFAFVTGGAIRYRIYGVWDISSLKIAQVIAFSNLSLWVGMLPIAGLIFCLIPFALPPTIILPLPFNSLRYFGVILLIISLVYLSLTLTIKKTLQWKNYIFRFPSLSLSLQQIITFALDWGFASLALYCLLDIPVSYLLFFGVYVMAMVAGLLSTIPGGLGVFETIILFFLSPLEENSVILGKMLVFRCIYYLLPFLAAVFALGLFEMDQRKIPK